MSIESQQDLEGMRAVGAVVALVLREMQAAVWPGVTTAELDQVAGAVLQMHGARSAPRLFYGFPGNACISVNDEAVHGIPGGRRVQAGDLVKLDVTAELDGYIADAAISVPVPPVSPAMTRLYRCAREAFGMAMEVALAGNRVNEIGRAVEGRVRQQGFAVIRDLRGHGVGRAIHEEPTVPNYYDRHSNQRLTEGLVLAVEPIIAAGSGRAVQDEDGWTIRTFDGSLAAHYEHTVVVTRGAPVVLTVV